MVLEYQTKQYHHVILTCDYDGELLLTGKIERPRGFDEAATIAKRRRVAAEEGALSLREQQATRNLRQMIQNVMGAGDGELDRVKAEFEKTLLGSTKQLLNTKHIKPPRFGIFALFEKF